MHLGMLPSQVLRLADDFQHVAFDYELVTKWLEERRKLEAKVAEGEDTADKLKDMEVWAKRQRGLR